ncbi:nitrate- and nitrite sensing domain-containing protein [Streptomyces sp. NBC_00377]|uniref:sensor histidine kinase n=1 Tax=unclassified Streptomyces TaxID=2593676 RepID=UPI002E23770F|nr:MULTISPECIES: nitrate- and nitrite sensing domain-containing protein [unclassified Streptomyces]
MPNNSTADEGRRKPFTRNWPVARRLRAVLLIPVLVALVLGGVRVKRSIDTWQDADDAVRVAELVQAGNKYASDAINERDLSVIPLLTDAKASDIVTQARAITDADARAFDAAVTRMPRTSGLLRRVQLVRAGEAQLAAVRANAFTSRMTGVQTEESYHTVQHPLMELSNELGFGSSNQASFGRTLYAVSLTQAAESLIRSIGTHLLVEDRDRLAPGELASQLASFRSYAYLEKVGLQEYAGAGTTEDMTRLRQALAAAEERGRQQTAEAAAQAGAAGRTFVAPPGIDEMINEIGAGKPTGELAARGITAQSFFAASTLGFDAYRGIQVNLTDTALTSAHDIADEARRDAVTNAALVLASVLVAFLLASWVARTMSTGMRGLSAAAIEIAGRRLPALIDQMSGPDSAEADTRVLPIPIDTTDEIGEVARAFDLVHREAVRLAAEQALLRGNINAIFTNLSHRGQSLIERQLALITSLEDNETDPEQLENLFRLDHLATRVRRNGENLLVLGGEKPAQQWDQPLPLVDVVRAASSEVEQYERIRLSGMPEAQIGGPVVPDLVHLLAELLENATVFSSPRSEVRVTAARLPDGQIMIEIHDEGIGLEADDFAMINNKLAHPPTVDVDIAQHMGLFVVGRLAERHGIRVQLRPSGEESGTTSLVMLPDSVTQLSPDALPDSDTLTLALLKTAPEARYAGATMSHGGQDSGDAFSDYEAWQDEPAGTRPPGELSAAPSPGGRPRRLSRRAPRRDRRPPAG